MTKGVFLFAALALLATDPVEAQPAKSLEACRDHREHGRNAEARRCYSDALRTLADPRSRAEAAWRLSDRKQANDLFRAAVAQRPKDAEARVAWGRLFLETHNRPEASKLFKEALAIDKDSAEAHLGLAMVSSGNFEGAAAEEANQALKLQPELTEAYILLASLALEEEDPAKANEHLDRALATKGSPLEAYALKAAIDFLAGKKESDWEKKALAYNPRYGDLYATAAHFFVITRRYREAVELYQRAVALDPQLWDAQSELGVNLWRLGDEAGARTHLEAAYKGDSFNSVTVNSLRLMDSMTHFRTFEGPHTMLKLQEKEAELLRPYFDELLRKGIAIYEKKYNFQLAHPVQVEVYPDHEDFAVRTMGMPGLGALGVTFGYLIAMDSPSGRPPGSFHWGSTLWHELNHVFVLELTHHKSPRWISEGLAVYEETVAGDGWGDRLTPDVIRAIKEKRLLPIIEMDRGFLHPKYLSQVPVSYFQAGAICELIASKWGFPKLLDMLKGYTAGQTTEQVVKQVLGIEPAEFDKQFNEFLKGRTEKIVNSFDPEWRKLMETSVTLAKEKKFEEALEPARRARDLYPEYTEAGNPYEIIAEALLAKGDKAGAAKELEQYRLNAGKHPRPLKQLASLYVDLGQPDKARHVLEQLLWIRPGDEELHTRLGDLLLAAKQSQGAIREFQSLLAVKPLDPAAAHFKMAQAYYQLNDREKTREHLLAALEAAPTYRPAQRLLLEINR
jgi:tetratricopeptide (TPR) repeat protein